MKRCIFLGLFLGLVVFSLSATDLSGSFSTIFGFGGTVFSSRNTLTLRFTLAGWEVQSLTRWDGLGLQRQSLTVAGSFGEFSLSAGVVLKPTSSWTFDTLSAPNFWVESGFVSVKFLIGNITVQLTFIAGER